jgi:SAM-dependent methyltransferase
MDDVGSFFDAQADAYRAGRGPMTPFHRCTARWIEQGLSGRVVAIGGLWDQGVVPPNVDLTVVDLSESMLAGWAEQGHAVERADARDLPFPDASVDHVVCALVLHHITEGGFRASREQISRVLEEIRRVLRPGGTVWISEFDLPVSIYALEAVASPFTKRALATQGIPLVVMHKQDTYRKRLASAGFSAIKTRHPSPDGTSGLDWLQPVIGLPWLRVPRFAYPLRPVLIQAIKH